MTRTISRHAVRYRLWLGILLFLGTGISAKAQTLLWTGATDQFWDNGLNWDSGTAPTSGDDVLFDGSATRFTSDISPANRTVNSLTIDSITAYDFTDSGTAWLAPGDVSVLSGTGHLFSAKINLIGGTTPTYNIADGADLTISSVIDEYAGGTAGLTKTGAGTLTFTGNNTYGGTTTISAGTLQVGNGGTTGEIASNIVNNGSLVFNHSGLSFYNGILNGSGDLTKEGAGELSLGGLNTFTGDTFINAGRIYLGQVSALQNSTVHLNVDSGLAFGSSMAFLGGLAGSGDLSLDPTTILVGANNADTTYSGVLSGSGVLYKQGTGTLTLTGDNTYTGGTTISAGTLQLGDGGTTGSLTGNVANNGTLAVNRSNDLTLSGTISGTGALTKDGTGTLILTANNTYTGGTTIGTGSTLQLGDGGTTGTVAGAIANSGALVVNRSNNFTLAGVISGTGSLTKEGAGTLSLTGHSTFSGDTVINGGAISISALDDTNYPFKNSTVEVNVDNGLVMDGSGAYFFGALAGSGNLNLNRVTSDLYLGYNNKDAVYSGNIAGGDTVYKEGTGTWTLTGTNLSFMAINVEKGSLVLDGATGAFSSIISTGGSLTLQNGADITTTSGNLASRLTVTGAGTALTVTDYSHNRGGWLVEDGASLVTGDLYNDYGETITVNQGSITIKSIVQSDASSPIQIADPTGGTALTFDLASDATFAGVISDYPGDSGTGSGGVLKSGTGTLTLTGDNTYTGGTTISAGTLQLGDGGATGSIVGDVANAGTLAVNSTGDITLGTVSGVGALTKAGAGTLTLTGDSTYTGGTTIGAGTLQLGDGGATGSLVGNVTNHGILVINRSADLTFSGVISGTGAFTQAGTGTLTLTAANTYAGTTTITAGTLRLGDGGTTGSLAGDIVNHGALVLDRSNFLAFGNAISGTGSLEQAGGGFTILAGENTFSGATTVTGGTLLLGHALALQNSTLTLDGAGAFDFNGTDATLGGLAGSNDLSLGSQAITIGNNGDDTTYAGVLSGTGSLTKTGAGTLTLTADNTYTGGTTLSAGTLQLGDGGTTGSILGDVANNGTLAFTHSDDLTFAGDISGTGGVTQNGTGVLSLTGANTFTGDVILNAGQVRLGSATEFATNTVVNNTTDGLDLNGFDATLGGLSGSGDLALGAQSLTVGGNGTPTTYAGALGGTGGLTKTGTGTLVLSGANTYTGGTTISAGTLQLGNGGATGSIQGDVANAGTLVFNRTDTGLTLAGVISGTGSVVQAGSGTTILTGANTYSGGTTVSAGTLQLGDGGTTGTLSGNVTTAAGGSLVFNRSNNLTYSGVVSGEGGLTQAGDGKLIVTTNQTFTGDTIITAGTLQLGNTSGSGIVSGDIVNDGALIISRSNNVTYSGVISGTGSFTKLGGGTLTLSGDSTFSGATNVNAGTLLISPNSSDALANSAVTIGTGGTLTMNDPDGATFSAASLAGSGTFRLGANEFDVGANNTDTTFSGMIIAADNNNAGIVNKYGSGALTFAGADIDVVFDVNSGEVVLDGITGVTGLSTNSGGKITVKNVGASLATNALTNAGESLVTGDATALNLSLYIYNEGQLTIDAGASLAAADYFEQESGATTIVDQASLSFGKFSGGATGTISISDPTSGGSALTFGRDGSDTSTFAGVIEDYTSGPGSVTKVGTNTIRLTGDNTYTGGTTISAGTLQLGNGGTTGSIVGDVANDGTLVFNRSDATTFSGTISGTGSVTQAGSGTTILTADHTYTGGTTISAGTLQLGDGGTTGSVALDQVTLAGGTLAFNRSDDITIGNVISGGGGLTQAGTGTLTLTANNTYTGTTTIETGGTLQLGNGGTTGTVAGAVANDGALVVNRSNDFTLAGVISGTGSLTKEGDGTLSLTGHSTFSGDTVINGGAISISALAGTDYPLKNSTVVVNVDDGLVLNASDPFYLGALAGSGNLTLGTDSASLFVGYNNADTVYSGNISGGDTVYKEGTGTWTLTGTNLDIDSLEVEQGSLVLDGAMGLINRFHGAGDLVTLQNGADIAASFGANFQSLLTVTGSGTSLSVANQLTNGGGVLVQDGGNLQVGVLYSSSGRTIRVNQSTLTIKDINPSDQTASIQIADPTGGTALTFDLASADTFAGVISDYTDDDGTLPGSVSKTGAGALTLSAANIHSGTTTISGGQIILGHALALQNSTVEIDVADGLDLNGFAATLGGLAGSGNLALGSQALTVGGNGDSTTYTGILSGTGGSLTKTGDGTLVLTGTNTYTGGTTIDGGTLQLGDGGTTGIVAGDIVNNGILTIDRTDDFTFSGLISGTGDLAKLGTGGDLTLGAANTFSGTTTIEEGRIFLGNSLALQNSTVELSRDYSLGLNSNNATLGALSGSGVLFVNGSRTLRVGGNDADTLYSGIVQGGGALTKQGVGTMVLTGNNTYAGTTTISAGTLQIGDGGTTGTIPGNVTNNATLAFNRTDNLTFAGQISGSGLLTQAGPGTLTLSGDNSYSGGTTINDGTLRLGHDNAAGTGTIHLDGGTLDTGSQAVSNAISFGTSGGTIKGTGTINSALTLNDPNQTLSPGNSPGILALGTSQSWDSFTYEWEINDWTGTTAGTDFDLIEIDGGLVLAGVGSGSYVLDIHSLTMSNVAGDVPNFGESDQTWILLTTTSGITGFDASYWDINTGSFSSDPAWAGSFSLDQVGNTLQLSYAVPEPSTTGLMIAGIATLLLRRRRHRKNQTPSGQVDMGTIRCRLHGF